MVTPKSKPLELYQNSKNKKNSVVNKPHLTAIVYDKRGRILSIGRNSWTKTHPAQARAAAKVGEPYKVYLHAEVDAIVRLSDIEKEKAYKMVVMRYNANGKPMNAKPCKVCQLVLSKFNLKIEHT